MKFLNIFSAFQILFYPGSHIPTKKYIPLVDSISESTNHPVHFVSGSFWKKNSPLHTYKNDTVLIGHSFGGYFALLDYLRFKDEKNIKGIVLLNSHFNSRNKAIYPGIKQDSIHCPVLTILSGKDTRLPIKIALDDIYEKNENFLNHKFYFINDNYTHFSGIDNYSNTETDQISKQITLFLKSIHHDNFRDIEKKSDCNRFEYCATDLVQNSINLAHSLNFIDAILSFILPKYLWEHYHWMYFLIEKPSNYFNYLFETKDYIYIKTKNCDVDSFHDSLQKLSFNKKIELFKIQLPTLHPSILLWLSLPIFIKEKPDYLQVPIINLPINNNTHYYRIPHPYKIFNRQY